MADFKTYEGRDIALLKNTMKNAPEGHEDSKSYLKLMRFFRRLSHIEFTDCLVEYDKEDDMWDIWIWLNKNILATFIFDEDPYFAMSAYVDKELIISTEFEDKELPEVVEKWKRISNKVRENEKITRKNSFWHNFCTNIKKMMNKIWKKSS